MKLSQLIKSYTTSTRLKARLKESIRFNSLGGGKTTFKAGTESDLLIDRGDGTFHFEAQHEAIIVEKHEIEII